MVYLATCFHIFVLFVGDVIVWSGSEHSAEGSVLLSRVPRGETGFAQASVKAVTAKDTHQIRCL